MPHHVNFCLPCLTSPHRENEASEQDLPVAVIAGQKEVDSRQILQIEDVVATLVAKAGPALQIYKGKAVDIKKVGRDQGVRYVLEGSVRKSSGRVRITAQLIDGASGGHVWSERYDRVLADIFDLQDEITQKIVFALKGVHSV